MITPNIPWVKKETKINDSENNTTSKLDKKMKAFNNYYNFNTIHRDLLYI